MEKEISFVAKHYRKGKFSAKKGWKRLNIAPSLVLRRIRIAAAVAGVVMLSATAAVIINQHKTYPERNAGTNEQVVENQKDAVRIIDLENIPLTDVISMIRDLYGVEVTGVPEKADTYMLSLHYTGNAAELIEAINDILGTKMTVAE